MASQTRFFFLALAQNIYAKSTCYFFQVPNLVVSAPFTKAKSEMIRQKDYEVQFPLEWMHKDLHLLSQTAYEHQHPLYLANLTKELFAQAIQAGLGRQDFAAVHEVIE